jgi:hypothetical protein
VRRREFITLVGGAAVAWPLTPHAQQPALPVIGFLHSASPDDYAPLVAGFRQGLAQAGYFEGRNIAIEYRWAEPKRSTAGVGGRSGSPSGDRDRRGPHAIGTRGQSGDHGDSDRLQFGRRPRQTRACCEPEPTGRQPDGRDRVGCGARAEATANSPRSNPERTRLGSSLHPSEWMTPLRWSVAWRYSRARAMAA